MFRNLRFRHPRRVIGYLGSLALMLGLALAAGIWAQDRPADDSKLVVVTADARHPFEVELAQTPAARSQGLMYRRSLPEDHGMLFIYPHPQPISMWMRNTYIPLDMLFIAADGRISHIAADTTPLSEESIPSNGPALAVLEINGGTAERLGIEVGDRVEHRLFAPR